MNATAPAGIDHGLQHLWLPESPAKAGIPPLAVARTHGSRLVLAGGRELVDGTAAHWTAVHGFNHPHIRAAVQRQFLAMPHVPLGALVHEQATVLAARLAHSLPGDLEHVLFCASRFEAVAAAMTMAARYWRNRGEQRRTKIVTFGGGRLSGARAGLPDSQYILDLPRDETTEAALDAFLDAHEAEVAALIAEPLVQPAGGMLFNDELCVSRLRQVADRHEILLILDETFTGFARTGAMFACEAARIVPDIITLGETLTGGTLPLAATVANRRLFDASHTGETAHTLVHESYFAGSPLACAAANASLDLFDSEPRGLQAAEIGKNLTLGLGPCIDFPGVTDVRVRGAIGVVEMDRIGRPVELSQRLLDAGVWVVPFRNVVALTPALTIGEEDLDILTSAVRTVLQRTLC